MSDVQMFWSLCVEWVEFLSQRKSGAVLMESRNQGQTDKQGLYQRKRSVLSTTLGCLSKKEKKCGIRSCCVFSRQYLKKCNLYKYRFMCTLLTTWRYTKTKLKQKQKANFLHTQTSECLFCFSVLYYGLLYCVLLFSEIFNHPEPLH